MMTDTKKVFKTALASLFVVAAILSLALFALACDDKPKEQATPTKLLLDYDDVKVDYLYDEPFTYSGLKVSTEMSDGNVVAVPSGYKVTPPDMSPGQHMVTVTYGSLTAKYPIYVEDVTKAFDDADAFTIKGGGVYTARADAIDLTKCEVEPLDAEQPYVKRTSSVFSAHGSYLQNIGAEGNCLGLAFSANAEYGDVSLVVTVGNMTDADIALGDSVAMYFGFNGGDDTGELDLDGATLAANSWQTLVFDGLDVYGGGNFIMEFFEDCDIVFDGIRVIVGADDVNSDSAVALSATGDPVKLEIENMNTEKLVTESAAVTENKLKFGQPLLKDFAQAADGKYVSDLKTGTKISAVIDTDGNATVNFKFKAELPEAYSLGDNWKFTLDTFTFDGIVEPAASGWAEVDLGSYPVKAGKHLFTAELVGTACNADGFIMTATEFDGDVGTLVEDVFYKDLTVYRFGSYKFEAEDMLDRSGWIPEFGTVDGMIEEWTHKNGAKGVSIGKVGRKKVETANPDDPDKPIVSYISTELKFHFLLKTRAKLSLKMSVADNNAVEGGRIPVERITTTVDGRKLTWSSNYKFGFDTEHTYWNFGEIVYSDIILEPGEYTISTKTQGIGYDWYLLDFADPTIDAYVHDFGTYRVEAEKLLNREGWVPNNGTIDEMVVGSYVSKIKPNSVFKVVFELDKKAAVKITARLSVWKCDSAGFNSTWMSSATIDGTATTFKGKVGSSFKDPSSSGSVNGWGVAESGFVTLEAGKHEVTWKSGDVSYDWFEIHAYDPDGNLPEYSFDSDGSYRISAASLPTMSNLDKNYGGPDGNYVTGSSANGKNFKVVFEIKQRSTVKISVRMSGWNSGSSEYNPSWMVTPKIGDTALTFTTQDGSDFKGSNLKWGFAESTVTLDAGIYEYTWKSGDVSYYWFVFDIAAATA